MDTATFVTVIGMWMLLIFGGIAIFLTYRNRRAALEMNHKERMSALERGLDPPPLPPEAAGQSQPARQAEFLHRGIVCIVVGTALMAALAINVGLASAAWALPLIAFGVVYLIIRRLGAASPGRRQGPGA